MNKIKVKDMNGKVWTVEFVNKRNIPKKHWGYCDRHKNIIKVRYDLSEKTVLDTYIHELLHSNNEILFEAEDFVSKLATALTNALLESGIISINLEGVSQKNDPTED